MQGPGLLMLTLQFAGAGISEVVGIARLFGNMSDPETEQGDLANIRNANFINVKRQPRVRSPVSRRLFCQVRNRMHGY